MIRYTLHTVSNTGKTESSHHGETSDTLSLSELVHEWRYNMGRTLGPNWNWYDGNLHIADGTCGYVWVGTFYHSICKDYYYDVWVNIGDSDVYPPKRKLFICQTMSEAYE